MKKNNKTIIVFCLIGVICTLIMGLFNIIRKDISFYLSIIFIVLSLIMNINYLKSKKIKTFNLMIITIMCLSTLIITFIGNYFGTSYKEIISLKVTESGTCDKQIIYYAAEARNYYLKCLDKIEVELDDEVYDLKSALSKRLISLENLLLRSETHFVYRDGGTSVYEYENFRIVKCNRIVNENEINNDIVIGTKDLDVNNGVCGIE